MSTIYDGQPQSGLTTTAGGAGSLATSTTGLWDTAATGSQGGWTDLKGGVWTDANGLFESLASAAGTSGYLNAPATRPVGEASTTTGIKVYIPAGIDVDVVHGVFTRLQGGSYYLSGFDLPSVAGRASSSYAVVGGAATSIGMIAATSGATYNPAHAYSLSVTPSGSSPTVLTVVVIDETAGTVISSSSNTIADSTASLQGVGTAGLIAWDLYGTGTVAKYSRVVISNSAGTPPTPSLTLSAATSTATDGGSTVAITATLANSSATLAASVAGGGTIATTAPTSGIAFAYTPPSNGTGEATVTVTDATDGLTRTVTINYSPASVTSLVAGVLTVSGISGVGINLAVSSISGGTGPFSTQLYGSTASGFTPGSGNAIGSPVTGSSPTFPVNSTAAGQVTFFRAITTDTETTPQTATTNQVAAAKSDGPNLVLGIIADSLFDPNQGTIAESLPYWTDTSTRRALQQIYGCRQVTFVNEAASGTDSGDWYAGGSRFAAALAAFQAAGVTDVLYQIGTNDVRTPANSYSAGHRPLGTATDSTTPGPTGSYAKNLAGDLAALKAAGLRVYLPGVPYFYPTSSFSGVVFDDASLNLAIAYNAYLGTLVDGVNVFGPATSTFEYFGNNQGEYYHENGATTNGVHPNAQGVDSYGVIHAAGLAKMLGVIPSTTATYTAASNVRYGTDRGDGTPGTCHVPTGSQVLTGVAVDATSGNVVLPPANQVAVGNNYGPNDATPGTLVVSSGPGGVAQTGDAYGLLESLLSGGALSAAALANVPRLGYQLAPAGLDLVEVESGVNARQALSPILAAAAGAITGNGTNTVTARAPTSAATARIVATMSGPDRISTSLTVPT